MVTPQTLPMPPSTTMASSMIEMSNRNRSGSTAVDVHRERRAADAAGDRADAVRRQLGPHERHAHRARGQLVLADGQPGPAQPAVAHPQRGEDDQRGQARRR